MHKQKGFTIVELIVVIVVIAILAAITLVGYSMVQKRANDTRRINDITTLQKSIEIYASENGDFPQKGTTGNDWTTSKSNPTNFITNLTGDSAGMAALPELPVDPTNTGVYYYRYFIYSAGSYGCDSSRGKFYVLQAMKFEASNDRPNKDSPGWGMKNGCTRDWGTEADFTIGGFLH